MKENNIEIEAVEIKNKYVNSEGKTKTRKYIISSNYNQKLDSVYVKVYGNKGSLIFPSSIQKEISEAIKNLDTNKPKKKKISSKKKNNNTSSNNNLDSMQQAIKQLGKNQQKITKALEKLLDD